MYSLTANWQATGTWKAVFTSETGKATTETSAVDASQTKTSSCIFLSKAANGTNPAVATMVYAILVPVTVAADADATPTINLP
jgi:glycine cleavage system protein P-like pyridoxal-binding family